MPRRGKMTYQEIDLDYLRSTFSYDPETGVFARVIARHPRAVLGPGCVKTRADGYQSVCVNTYRFDLHRIIWLYHYGTVPPCTIDHINGNPQDNRIANLRLATPSQNEWNKPAQRRNVTGRKGVIFSKTTGKYSARISAHKKSYHLGTFATADEASAAYADAAKRLHGNFARST